MGGMDKFTEGAVPDSQLPPERKDTRPVEPDVAELSRRLEQTKVLAGMVIDFFTLRDGMTEAARVALVNMATTVLKD